MSPAKTFMSAFESYFLIDLKEILTMSLMDLVTRLQLDILAPL